MHLKDPFFSDAFLEKCMTNKNDYSGLSEWKYHFYHYLFDENSPTGKIFNSFLLLSILLSILAVILGSMEGLKDRFGHFFEKAEWFFTILFFIEYILRLISVRQPLKYAFSFYGIIDFMAFMPLFLELISFGAHNFITIRAFRILRIFRLFKLYKYLYEADILKKVLKASLKRIIVFLLAVFTLIILIGTLIYAIEGPENGFIDIPTSIYWTIVTITTVGFGDIAPQTFPGKFLASIVMLLGYGMIAVPTGIVTLEFNRFSKMRSTAKECLSCGGHNDSDATFCKYCGTLL